MSLNTTFVIVHYRTPILIQRCHYSIREFYPEVPVIIVDGGSYEANSMKVLRRLAESPKTEVILKPRNIGHGPGLHAGIKAARTGLVLTMDSDCLCKQSGFIEAMKKVLYARDNVYACGQVVRVDPYGSKVDSGGTLYCRPVTALWRRNIYLQLPAFDLHGAPCLRNVLYAKRQGWTVADFPVESYVNHLKRGTRAKHGNHWANRGAVQ